MARCPDDMSRASLEGSLARWRDANWEALAGVVREEAVEAARRTSHQWDRDFARFLWEWPRLRDDRELLEAAIGYAETAGKAINGALKARSAANCMVLHPACHDDPVNFFNLHGFYPDNLRRK